MNDLLYVDLFCGAGGVSSGIARTDARLLACVNHDMNAIRSHQANHPTARHYTEDIRTLDLTDLKMLVQDERQNLPRAKLVLWASLECTHFSKARGGQKRNDDSRTLAEHLFRYIDELQPEYIQIENVVEFETWGDLDESGQPCKKTKGKKFDAWVAHIIDQGYSFQKQVLDSKRFGAATSRTRLFITFTKEGSKEPLSFDFKNQHHSSGVPVKNVLDLNEHGQSIFFRKKPLVEPTLERIYRGLIKFYKQENFMVSYYGNGNALPITAPCPTVTTKDRFALVKVQWLRNPQYKNIGSSIDKPCFTLIARMDKAPPYLMTALSSPVSADDEPHVEDYFLETGCGIWESKIKAFMSLHGISDICMRMLTVKELKLIMGFDEDYILIGTQTEQKKFIGNAVEVNTAEALVNSVIFVNKNQNSLSKGYLS